MRIAICDDEKYVRSFIRKLIEKQGTDCEIREYSSGRELLKSQGLSGYWGETQQSQGLDGYCVESQQFQRLDGYCVESQQSQGPGGCSVESQQSQGLGGYWGETQQSQGLGGYWGETQQFQGSGSHRGELQQSRRLGSGTGEIQSGSHVPETIDILFLDISMEDMDGMTAAKLLRESAKEQEAAVWGSLPLLIFISGYPEYVMEAFSVHAYQFLVKPIEEKEFAAVFDQAVRECRILKRKKQKTSRELLVHKRNTTRKVLEADIYYVESSNRKVILCLNSEKITYYGKISGLEEELSESFFRVHKGYLVNMKYVERYSRTEVWMKNGDKLLISRYKYQDFVKAYLRYISDGNC